MPKILEFTFELVVDKVSCPGVWLCQDGRVSLTVYAMGTSYQTCMVPPLFPLVFKDVFYFRKRFQEICTLRNVTCLLKDETLYCELVQWTEDCSSNECTILAQYLGSLNDVLFPPNMCANDGVDLLMRRSKEFPGILSPKIEIATKVRIDEVYNQPCSMPPRPTKIKPCACGKEESEPRQKQVCHTPLYHKVRCTKRSPAQSRSRSRSRSWSQSGGSRSCCSLAPRDTGLNLDGLNDSQCSRSRTSVLSGRHQERCKKYHQYHVYNVVTTGDAAWPKNKTNVDTEKNGMRRKVLADKPAEALDRQTVESRYIALKANNNEHRKEEKKYARTKITPCVCEICKRYYELFHEKARIS